MFHYKVFWLFFINVTSSRRSAALDVLIKYSKIKKL